MATTPFKASRWFAERLGIGVTTFERLRSAGNPDLPPAILIGPSVRDDEAAVEHWIADRTNHSAAPAALLQTRNLNHGD